MDTNFFLKVLSIESISSRERQLADFLAEVLPVGHCKVERFPADAPASAPVNIMLSWGRPKVVFCTHIDIVPPYIPPTVEQLPDGDAIVRGRGTCDAKGQIMAMYEACRRLSDSGASDFGLLLLYGEETGSFGAKEFRTHPGAKYLIVGEPTDNRMVSATKGTKAFDVKITGKSCHSGYPQYGDSAIERFVDIANEIRSWQFPVDELLGPTTYNIGKLLSDNPQNILSPWLTCRVYFRTTFASDALVVERMLSLNSHHVKVASLGGDAPMRYLTIPGFPTEVAAFGSDAPQLTNFEHRALCGPGSILKAHTDDEQIRLSEIEQAADNYVKMYNYLISR